MKPKACPRLAFQRFAEGRIMRWMALLVVLLLPLQGVASAIGSIQAPAHYHLDTAQLHNADPSPQATTYQPLHDDDVLVLLDGDTTTRPSGEQGDGPTRIGHHAHAFSDADVVYLNGDSDPSDPGSAGKHVPVGGDALLPGWSMPPLLATATLALSEPASDYRSHQVEPPMRPPSGTELVSA